MSLNPKPDTYHLRHVGLLGAEPPAVKGLRPVEFAGGRARWVSRSVKVLETLTPR